MFQKTVLLVSYPTSFSKESCDILKEHLEDLGAYRVYFEQEIWIAAIGAKLDLFLPVASCVYWFFKLRYCNLPKRQDDQKISLQRIWKYNQHRH